MKKSLAQMIRDEAVNSGRVPPTIRESGLSRRAKNILKRAGYEANDSILQIDHGYKDLLDIKRCGPHTAMEISKIITKIRREHGSKS